MDISGKQPRQKIWINREDSIRTMELPEKGIIRSEDLDKSSQQDLGKVTLISNSEDHTVKIQK